MSEETKPYQVDNWKDRNARMQCVTCLHFVKKCGRSSDALIMGRCRKHAPTLNGWPVVYCTDWCGDHKLDEDKT